MYSINSSELILHCWNSRSRQRTRFFHHWRKGNIFSKYDIFNRHLRSIVLFWRLIKYIDSFILKHCNIVRLHSSINFLQWTIEFIVIWGTTRLLFVSNLLFYDYLYFLRSVRNYYWKYSNWKQDRCMYYSN